VGLDALLGPGGTLEPQHLGLTPAAGLGSATVEPDGLVHVDFARGAVDLEQVERSLIEQALTHSGWNRGRAAKLLGLTKETLRYRIEKYGLSPKP
jgi:DNA-binding NtrC family response regulator